MRGLQIGHGNGPGVAELQAVAAGRTDPRREDAGEGVVYVDVTGMARHFEKAARSQQKEPSTSCDAELELADLRPRREREAVLDVEVEDLVTAALFLIAGLYLLWRVRT